jgi:hypothetical protein
MDDLYEAFAAPYSSRLSPDRAAAHLLALGADGQALCELASLSERDFDQALELIPTAWEEAKELLRPVRERREAPDSEPAEAFPAVIIAWSTDSIGERIDDLGTFLDDVSRQVQRAALGEVDGLVDQADEQVAFCYGHDLPALQRFLEERMPLAPVQPQRVELRSDT